MDLSVLQHLPHLALVLYTVLFFAMFVEANLTTIATAVLISHGQLSPWLAILVVVAGAFGEQFFLYFVGSHLRKHSRFLAWVQKWVGRHDYHLTEKTSRTLFISKFVYGLHRTVLLRCGMTIGLKKFARATLFSTTLWLSIMFVLGFIFSASYNALSSYLKYGAIVLLLLLIVFLASQYFLSKRLSKDF